MRWVVISMMSLLLVFATTTVCAGVSNDLKSYFDQLGYSANITSPHAYEGQRAGYLTGGSLFARNEVRDIQIAHIDLPSVRSGCGGIDFYTGGIQIINKKEFVHALKNILSSGGSYAMTLALEEMSPLIANVMKYWQQSANFINQANLNSCEMGEALVGGLWPNTRSAKQRVCQDLGTSNGYFTDWALARQGCGAGGDTDQVLSQGKNNPQYKDLVLKEGNLAWQAIQKNNFLRGNAELSYLFMTLSGTVIVKKKAMSVIPSGISNKKLLGALLYGGEAEIRYCTDSTAEDKCLELGRSTVTINTEDAFQGRVKTILASMVSKMRSDQKLSAEEIGLIENTSIPILSILRAQVAFNQLRSPVHVEQYAEIIALDILLQYLDESIRVVRNSALLLPYPEKQFEEFNKGIDNAESAIKALRKSAYEEVTKLQLIIEQTQFMEKMLAGSLSTELASSLSWANNLRGRS